jgi:hypothetical protein
MIRSTQDVVCSKPSVVIHSIFEGCVILGYAIDLIEECSVGSINEYTKTGKITRYYYR